MALMGFFLKSYVCRLLRREVEQLRGVAQAMKDRAERALNDHAKAVAYGRANLHPETVVRYQAMGSKADGILFAANQLEQLLKEM
jgi:hypothetical protein